MPDARVTPAEALLVRLRRVVLLRHVVAEEEVRERLVTVRVMPRNVDRDRVLVTDVLAERLAARTVEDDHTRRPLETGKEVVLAALVVVEPSDHALPGEDEIRLQRRPWERTLPPQLGEPAALVLKAVQRDAEEPLDHAVLLTPVRAISEPISGSDSWVPASSHQPRTRWQASDPRSA